MGSRQHTRTSVELMPRIRPATQLEYYQAHCRNLSLGGLLLESGQRAAPGTLIKIECDDAAAGSFAGVGVVAWEQPLDGGARAVLGVRFVRLKEGSETVIAEIVGDRPVPAEDGGAVASRAEAHGSERGGRRRRKVQMDELAGSTPGHDAGHDARPPQAVVEGGEYDAVRVPMRNTARWVAVAMLCLAVIVLATWAAAGRFW